MTWRDKVPRAGRPELIRGLQGLDRLLCRFGWLLLLLSVLLNLARLASQPSVATVDLWVYREASPHVFTGDLWTYRYGDPAGDFPLPFTYPPFAALVLMLLAALPWALVKYGWRVLSLVALWFIVHRSLSLLSDTDEAHRNADMRRLRQRSWYWTAFTVLLEPIHSTLNFGQVNLLLAALVMAALTARRSWLAGLGIGVAAGIKLVPAVSALFFLARKRWIAVTATVVTFLATIALAFLVAPGLTAEYFATSILGGGLAVGVPVGSVINQSLRGALGRTVGHDVGTGALWLACVFVALVLTVLAARSALRTRDTLALIVAVEIFGLLASPVSWSHYWVWVVPLLIWLAYGPARARPSTMRTCGMWLLLTGSFLIKWLVAAQPSIWEFSRPWYLAALGWAYPAAGLLTLVVIWRSAHAGRGLSESPSRGVGGLSEARIRAEAPRSSAMPRTAADRGAPR